ncbi:nidogen-2-like [Gadus macrocephalus]|uniref:nidogen-2-like n=1 Tax=Gadus macrocephalus TaxID=80720 RepID=UPI0028CBA2CD|nr:nidogen-2-like [Gadus macrocephalus]
MAEGTTVSLFLLSLWCSASVTAAVQRSDIFPYGTPSGDLTLAEGDDETSKVLTLPRPLYFYNTQFSELYVATNGIISAQDLPMEKQYVDDGFPTDFPVVAPFLADLDTSGGRGQIYYRLTETPSVLNRVSQCHFGYEFSYDGRSCVDVDECRSSPCHADAGCSNGPGSFRCQCRPGFHGDGFQCSPHGTGHPAVLSAPRAGVSSSGTACRAHWSPEAPGPS